MKQAKIYLIAATLLLTKNNDASAQWSSYLSTTATAPVPANTTYTAGGVGIGLSSAPSPVGPNSFLHIYGNPSLGPSSCGTTVNYYPSPELWIDRQEGSPCFRTLCTPPASTNYFQVSNTGNMCVSPGTGATVYKTQILDVIDPHGWLGIMQPNPTEPLDVGGNAYIEQDLQVHANSVIGNNLTVNKNATIDKTLTVLQNGSIGTTLTVGTIPPSIAANTLAVGGNTGVSGKLNVIQSGSIGTTLSVGTIPTSIAGNTLAVGGNTGISGKLKVLLDATIDGTLTVNGALINLNNAIDANYRNINGNSLAGVLSLSAKTGSGDGANIELYGQSYSAAGGRAGVIHYCAYGPSSSTTTAASPSDYEHLFLNYDPTPRTYSALMGIQRNGKVVVGQNLIWNSTGIADPTPDGYLLYVQKGILTEKLKVASSDDPGNWSDFVFNDDYKLMPINQVASYVKANKHLPEIPSATDVAKDGIDVADMDSKLLQKIEELTLYVIQQQKEIDELKQQVKH